MHDLTTKDAIQILLRPGAVNIFDRPEVQERLLAAMPETHRATMTLGRSSTQFRAKNLSLLMLGRGPYFLLRQCLSQIERRRQALLEAHHRADKNRLKLERARRKLAQATDDLDRREAEVAISHIGHKVAEEALYIEGALKEIAQWQSIYQQVKEHCAIPDNWDEMDAERAEADTHIRQAFLQGLRSYLCNGRIAPGESEYLENVGVHPLQALSEIMQHAEQCAAMVDRGETLLTGALDDWLDEMAKKYKDAPAKVLARWGINPVDAWYTYQEPERIADRQGEETWDD